MKLDFAETLVLVVTVYFFGIVFYIHAATYGSGGFLVSRNMAGFCYVGEEMKLVQCDSVPWWYIFDENDLIRRNTFVAAATIGAAEIPLSSEPTSTPQRATRETKLA
jgi:hypothetical protein